MREYHKIETVFNRDIDGTKKLIEGDFRSETLEFLKDCEFEWTEKVDGTNVRIYWDGHTVTLGGRTDKAQIPADLVNYLNKVFCTPEAEEMFEQKFGESTVILFGEGYGRKIQGVGSLYIPDGVSFIMFDVMVGETWLKRESVEDIAKCFGVDVVPIVGRGTIAEAVEYVKTHKVSTISEKAPLEGVVCRPRVELFDRMGRRVIVKIKGRDFT
jgi:ATP-dependent RNA circularization protein (DNA/RNA ligase family)